MPTGKKAAPKALEANGAPAKKKKSLREETGLSNKNLSNTERTEKLRLRIEKFCQVYVVHLNVLEASLAAGYPSSNAYQQGWRLLGRVETRERLAELRKKLYGNEDGTKEQLLEKLRSLALSDTANSRTTQATDILSRHYSIGEKKDGSVTTKDDPGTRETEFTRIRSALERARKGSR